MIKITRNLEEFKREIQKLGPRKKHIKRGKPVMKIIKPNEASAFQANFNAECRKTEEIKDHVHRVRENHKYDIVLERITLTLMPVIYIIWTVAIVYYVMG